MTNKPSWEEEFDKEISIKNGYLVLGPLRSGLKAFVSYLLEKRTREVIDVMPTSIMVADGNSTYMEEYKQQLKDKYNL